jgi:hypothetical protein
MSEPVWVQDEGWNSIAGVEATVITLVNHSRSNSGHLILDFSSSDERDNTIFRVLSLKLQ